MSVFVEAVNGYVNLDKVKFVSVRRGESGYTYRADVGDGVYELTKWGAKRFSATSDTGLIHVVPNTNPDIVAVVFYSATDEKDVQSEDDIKLETDTHSIVAWRVYCDGDDYNSAKPVMVDHDAAINDVLFVHNKALDTYQTYGYSPLSLQEAKEVAKTYLFSAVIRERNASSLELQLD